MTNYHSKYYSHFLTLQQPNDSTQRLGGTFLNAKIDLNPHQVKGALSFFKNPLSKGVMLADEVGLGKTIEAGLVICQLWSEYKRNILLVVPASLRKQWRSELEEKFFLGSTIIDGKSYKQMKKSGIKNPFDQSGIVIASYAFTAKHEIDVVKVSWDLVVFDEAHKLRNVYKDKKYETRAGKLYKATRDCKKLLLTATPLQNSLMELYGLVSYIDDYTFGGVDSYRKQFSQPDIYKIEELRKRLAPLVNRTLREHVKEYIRYTNRISITQKFDPTDVEMELYEKVSEFLQRDDLVSINNKTKHLIILVLRKLLASSSRAIAGTFQTMIDRLETKRDLSNFTDEDDLLEEYEEYVDDDDEQAELQSQMEKLSGELQELKEFFALAKSIDTDTKASALLTALDTAFIKLEELGANKKALIFTESRRTQDYLKAFLESHGYKGKIVLFNGSNNSNETKETYKHWLQKNQGTSKVSGSKESDIRASLVEHFRDEAEIMIATESASEGVNMQFCSLLINYDLPWNPQRIEQRIGRCHRYGQKHDVLVVNFLNTKNHADQRVFELLSEKFELFDGVFGTSDEILGAIDDGGNFEQRILKIYQECRSPEEIDIAFTQLQNEYKDTINNRIAQAKKSILEHFDAEVIKRLKNIEAEGADNLDIYQKYFWYLSKNELDDVAQFDDEKLTFSLESKPESNLPIKSGAYTLQKRNDDSLFFYRPNSPLGTYCINNAKERDLSISHVLFKYDEVNPRVTGFRDRRGVSGWMKINKLCINTFDQEEYLVVVMITDAGDQLHPDLARKVFHMPGVDKGPIDIDSSIDSQLSDTMSKLITETYHDSMDRNSMSFQDEIAKLDAWEEDKKLALLKELEEIKEEIQVKRKESLRTDDRELKLGLRQEAMKLEVSQRKKQEAYFAQVKEIEDQKWKLIQQIEEKMQAGKQVEDVFTIRWTIE